MSEFESFLVTFHAKYPSCTPLVFADGKTIQGYSSYDILANLVPNNAMKPISVLDLACGDGYLLEKIALRSKLGITLTGIDFSPGELFAGKKRLERFTIPLLEGKAQNLPFSDSSMDFVLCHMAFMLMDDIETVIQEIHRVLKPNGVFSAVIGAGNRVDVIYAEFLRLLKEVQIDEGKCWSMKVGDSRIFSESGLKELFSKVVSGPITIQDYPAEFLVEPHTAVRSFLLTYDVAVLSPAGREKLETMLLGALEKFSDLNGKIRFSQVFRQFTVVKGPATNAI